MNQLSQFSFSRRNAVFSGLCLGGLTLLFLVSVVPLQSQHHALDQELASLQNDRSSQRQYQISIAMVEGLLSQLDQQPGPQVITISPLAQDKTGQILEDVKAIAAETSLELKTIEPRLENKNSWQTLTVQAELHGGFPNLQPFLLKLLTLPYVKQIERIEVHPDGSGLNFSLTYTIILA